MISSGLDDLEVRQAETETLPPVADPPGVLGGSEGGGGAGVTEDRSVLAEPGRDDRLRGLRAVLGDDPVEGSLGEAAAMANTFPPPEPTAK